MSSRPQAVPHVHISEPHVRVTEWRFAPGAETGWHRHEADYVVVPLADGDLLLEEPGGGPRTATLKRHVPYARREGVEHNVVNANPFDFAFIEIEHLTSRAARSADARSEQALDGGRPMRPSVSGSRQKGARHGHSNR
jgi:beta-alanine degradation protein BauB